jgi:drug/metabolite transporter (DMT)-like permease
VLSVLIGLAAAAAYGSGDFLGGLAARRLPGTPSSAAVGWGVASGVAGAASIALLYACLAIGPMSILSPLTAVVSAVVPVGVGLLQGSRLGPAGWAGIALALVAVVLVGFVPDASAPKPTAAGLLMALAAGAGIGVVLVFLDQTPADSGLVPLVANRVTNVVLTGGAVAVLALVALTRSRSQPRGGAGRAASTGPVTGAGPQAGTGPQAGAGRPRLAPALRLALLCGVADAGANVLILVGLRLGDLTVMSVLTALYSAVTVVLAAVVLRERLTRSQVVGLVLALGAAVLLALD